MDKYTSIMFIHPSNQIFAFMIK